MPKQHGGQRKPSKRPKLAAARAAAASPAPVGNAFGQGVESVGDSDDESDWDDAEVEGAAPPAISDMPAPGSPSSGTFFSPGHAAVLSAVGETHTSRMRDRTGRRVSAATVDTYELGEASFPVDNQQRNGARAAAAVVAQANRPAEALSGTRHVLEGMTAAQLDTVGVAMMSAFQISGKGTLDDAARSTASILGAQLPPTAPRKRPRISTGRIRVAYLRARVGLFHKLPRRLRAAIVNSKPLLRLVAGVMVMRFTRAQIARFMRTGDDPRLLHKNPKAPAHKFRAKHLRLFLLKFGAEFIVDVELQRRAAVEQQAAGVDVDAVPEAAEGEEVLASSKTVAGSLKATDPSAGLRTALREVTERLKKAEARTAALAQAAAVAMAATLAAGAAAGVEASAPAAAAPDAAAVASRLLGEMPFVDEELGSDDDDDDDDFAEGDSVRVGEDDSDTDDSDFDDDDVPEGFDSSADEYNVDDDEGAAARRSRPVAQSGALSAGLVELDGPGSETSLLASFKRGGGRGKGGAERGAAAVASAAAVVSAAAAPRGGGGRKGAWEGRKGAWEGRQRAWEGRQRAWEGRQAEQRRRCGRSHSACCGSGLGGRRSCHGECASPCSCGGA